MSERDEEILALHRQLAAEKLRADQGWERAEAKTRECNELRERAAQPVAASASGLEGLTRYEPANGRDHGGRDAYMFPVSFGDYVKFSDVESLLATQSAKQGEQAIAKVPANESERAIWVGIIDKVRAKMLSADASDWMKNFLVQMLDSIDVYVRQADVFAAQVAQERAPVAEVPSHWAKWIAQRGPGLPDHACAECVPHSDMLKQGFQCVYHQARSIYASTTDKSEG